MSKQDLLSSDMQNRYKRLGTWRKVAAEVGKVSPMLCWKVANGAWSAKLARRVGLAESRVRIRADVTRAQRDRLHAIAAAEGLTWSEYCRRLADED